MNMRDSMTANARPSRSGLVYTMSPAMMSGVYQSQVMYSRSSLNTFGIAR